MENKKVMECINWEKKAVNGAMVYGKMEYTFVGLIESKLIQKLNLIEKN